MQHASMVRRERSDWAIEQDLQLIPDEKAKTTTIVAIIQRNL
jgi:hypothetical protein